MSLSSPCTQVWDIWPQLLQVRHATCLQTRLLAASLQQQHFQPCSTSDSGLTIMTEQLSYSLTDQVRQKCQFAAHRHLQKGCIAHCKSTPLHKITRACMRAHRKLLATPVLSFITNPAPKFVLCIYWGHLPRFMPPCPPQAGIHGRSSSQHCHLVECG